MAEPLKMVYEKDAPLDALKGKTVAIIGFGSRRLKYDSGRELDWMKIGFSPRKGKTSLYLTSLDALVDDLTKFGKHTTSKGCIYVKRLDDVDQKVLEKMIKKSLRGK